MGNGERLGQLRFEEGVQGCGIKVHTAFAKLNTEPAIDALPSPVVVFVFFTEPPPSFPDEEVLELIFAASSKLSCLVAIIYIRNINRSI